MKIPPSGPLGPQAVGHYEPVYVEINGWNRCLGTIYIDYRIYQCRAYSFGKFYAMAKQAVTKLKALASENKFHTIRFLDSNQQWLGYYVDKISD